MQNRESNPQLAIAGDCMIDILIGLFARPLPLSAPAPLREQASLFYRLRTVWG